MVDNLRFFAGAARCLEGKAAGEYMRGYTSMVRREPVGSPGHRALELPADDGHLEDRPCARAGQHVVLKPAEQTPLTTLRLAELRRTCFPAGGLQHRHGRRRSRRRGNRPAPGHRHRLADRRGRDRQEIARERGRTLKRVHLELGGKAPMIVFDDADPVEVAQAVRVAGYWNSARTARPPPRSSPGRRSTTG